MYDRVERFQVCRSRRPAQALARSLPRRASSRNVSPRASAASTIQRKTTTHRRSISLNVGKAGVGNREQTSLARLGAELERLADELVRLSNGEREAEAAPPPPPGGERPADRLRRRLLEARRARGLRQSDLADRLGRPQSFVSNYQRGERRLEVSELIVIARVLGVDAAAVLAELVEEG